MANSDQRKNQIKEHLNRTTDVNFFQRPGRDVDQRKQRIKDHVRRSTG